MIHFTDKEVYTDDSTKVVHRIGTDIYATHQLRFKSDTAEMFEEVDAPVAPAITEVERKQRIQAKIHERYSLDDEIALIRQKDDSDAKRAAYEEYCTYAEMCKQEVDSEIADKELKTV